MCLCDACQIQVQINTCSGASAHQTWRISIRNRPNCIGTASPLEPKWTGSVSNICTATKINWVRNNFVSVFNDAYFRLRHPHPPFVKSFFYTTTSPTEEGYWTFLFYGHLSITGRLSEAWYWVALLSTTTDTTFMRLLTLTVDKTFPTNVQENL